MGSEAKRFGIQSITPKAPAPNSGQAAKPPVVDMPDYPSDGSGPVTGNFKDRSVLKKAGLIAGTIVTSLVANGALEVVKKHFHDVVGKARKEFQSKFPDPAGLWRNARIDQHREAYEAALKKLNAPSAARAAGAVVVAMQPEKDQEAAARHVQNQLSKVKLADGAIGGFEAAAKAYINAMVNLNTKLETYDYPDLAEDIKRRASILQRTGDKLKDTFWAGMKAAALSPIVYYPWLDVHAVSEVFLDLAGTVGAFANEISGRMDEYVRMIASLEKELVKVSDTLGKYVPKE
jgi:hypothetical protein